MEIFLDDESAPIYGLAVTYMQVSDARTDEEPSQEETIIHKG
jgi:hypothetical protein